MDSRLNGSLSFMEDIKEAGSEKMNELVSKIQQLDPLIDVMGFNMHEIDVDIGIFLAFLFSQLLLLKFINLVD